jgi:hypothetical protein
LRASAPAETSGANPEVAPKAAPVKPSPRDCTAEQLFEIVLDVARRFRTAKEAVAENRGYILLLKSRVFKVRFGSAGVRVPVTFKDKEGLPATRQMAWKEFCETQFA